MYYLFIYFSEIKSTVDNREHSIVIISEVAVTLTPYLRCETDHCGCGGLSRTWPWMMIIGHLISEQKLKCLMDILLLKISIHFSPKLDPSVDLLWSKLLFVSITLNINYVSLLPSLGILSWLWNLSVYLVYLLLS